MNIDSAPKNSRWERIGWWNRDKKLKPFQRGVMFKPFMRKSVGEIVGCRDGFGPEMGRNMGFKHHGPGYFKEGSVFPFIHIVLLGSVPTIVLVENTGVP